MLPKVYYYVDIKLSSTSKQFEHQLMQLLQGLQEARADFRRCLYRMTLIMNGVRRSDVSFSLASLSFLKATFNCSEEMHTILTWL